MATITITDTASGDTIARRRTPLNAIKALHAEYRALLDGTVRDEHTRELLGHVTNAIRAGRAPLRSYQKALNIAVTVHPQAPRPKRLTPARARQQAASLARTAIANGWNATITQGSATLTNDDSVHLDILRPEHTLNGEPQCVARVHYYAGAPTPSTAHFCTAGGNVTASPAEVLALVQCRPA